VLALVLLLSTPVNAQYFGRGEWRGFFTNTLDTNGNMVFTQGSTYGTSGASVTKTCGPGDRGNGGLAVDNISAIVGTIKSRLSSGGQNGTGAAFIINTMLGISGSSASRNPATADADRNGERDLAQWERIVRSYDAEGLVSFNTCKYYPKEFINSYYQGSGSNDDAFYTQSESEYQLTIIFRHPDTNAILFQIKQNCGNPAGIVNPLPEIPAPTGNPPTGNYKTIGGSACQVHGWARDPDYSGAITVAIRQGGSSTSNTQLFRGTANVTSPQYPTQTNRGFVVNLPNTYKNGNTYQIYMNIVDVDSSGAYVGSVSLGPKSITCSIPPPPPGQPLTIKCTSSCGARTISTDNYEFDIGFPVSPRLLGKGRAAYPSGWTANSRDTYQISIIREGDNGFTPASRSSSGTSVTATVGSNNNRLDFGDQTCFYARSVLTNYYTVNYTEYYGAWSYYGNADYPYSTDRGRVRVTRSRPATRIETRTNTEDSKPNRVCFNVTYDLFSHLEALGSDVHAGGGLSSLAHNCSVDSGAKIKFSDGIKEQSFKSYGQFMVSALNSIRDYGSNNSSTLDTLTLKNSGSDGYYNTSPNNMCRPDFEAELDSMPDMRQRLEGNNVVIQETNLSGNTVQTTIQSLSPGRYVVVDTVTGASPVIINGANIPSGVQVTFLTQRPVEIRGNITRDTSGYADASDIPAFAAMTTNTSANSIRFDKDVTSVFGIFYTKGSVDTCYNRSITNNSTQRAFCASSLNLEGLLSASDYQFRRTTASTSTTYAESVDFVPELYLSMPPLLKELTETPFEGLKLQLDSELPPRL